MKVAALKCWTAALVCLSLLSCASVPDGQKEAERLADKYIESFPDLKNDPYKAKFARQRFLRDFRHGFMHPESGSTTASQKSISGVEAGRAYRHRHSEQLEQVMVSFGYVPFDETGTWLNAFEISYFEPDSWSTGLPWLSILGDSAAQNFKRPESNCRRLRVVGFLSPKGQYGHMGTYTHEIFASEIYCIE